MIVIQHMYAASQMILLSGARLKMALPSNLCSGVLLYSKKSKMFIENKCSAVLEPSDQCWTVEVSASNCAACAFAF
jgi:hypothetical protein